MDRMQEWWTQLVVVFRDTVAGVVTYVPVVLTALAVMAIGWVAALLTRSLVRRALQSMDWVFARFLSRSGRRSEALTRATSRAVGSVAFWIVLLVFAASGRPSER